MSAASVEVNDAVFCEKHLKEVVSSAITTIRGSSIAYDELIQCYVVR